MPDNTDALLADRAKTHGDYADHAKITQETLGLWACQHNSRKLNYMQSEALHMIAHKVGRILAGDPNFRDHWDDIAGYARLVAERLPKPTDKAADPVPVEDSNRHADRDEGDWAYRVIEGQVKPVLKKMSETEFHNHRPFMTREEKDLYVWNEKYKSFVLKPVSD